MRKIIYTRPDGGVSVVHPVRNTYPSLEALTDAEIEQRAWAKLPKDAINPQWIDASAIPTDRTFRNAWKQDGQAITHDMDKCRAIYKDELRSKRAEKMKVLDAAWMKAVAQGDSKTASDVEAVRQQLRDLPAAIEIVAASTPDELKAFKPAVLQI